MTQPTESSLKPINWMTVAEVAAYFRVVKMTVYRWIHAGELPATAVGRTFRIDERDVEKLREANRVVVGESESSATP